MIVLKNAGVSDGSVTPSRPSASRPRGLSWTGRTGSDRAPRDSRAPRRHRARPDGRLRDRAALRPAGESAFDGTRVRTCRRGPGSSPVLRVDVGQILVQDGTVGGVTSGRAAGPCGRLGSRGDRDRRPLADHRSAGGASHRTPDRWQPGPGRGARRADSARRRHARDRADRRPGAVRALPANAGAAQGMDGPRRGRGDAGGGRAGDRARSRGARARGRPRRRAHGAPRRTGRGHWSRHRMARAHCGGASRPGGAVDPDGARHARWDGDPRAPASHRERGSKSRLVGAGEGPPARPLAATIGLLTVEEGGARVVDHSIAPSSRWIFGASRGARRGLGRRRGPRRTSTSRGRPGPERSSPCVGPSGPSGDRSCSICAASFASWTLPARTRTWCPISRGRPPRGW